MPGICIKYQNNKGNKIFNSFLKIYNRLESPQITIPCLGGLDCQIVVHEKKLPSNSPGAAAQQTRERMKNHSISSIVIESKQTKARLTGSVEILYNGESQSGLFGDETKDIFTDWGKDIMGWEFQDQVTLSVVNFNGF